MKKSYDYTSTRRQSKRRDELNKIAQEIGIDSWSKLETEAINRKVDIKMTPKNVFKSSEINSNRDGWVVDLSPEDKVNPDCYWFFSTKKRALIFNELVKSGKSPHEALHEIS